MPASFEEAVDEELERMVLENLDYLDRPGRLAVSNLSEELSPERRQPPKVNEIPVPAPLTYAGATCSDDLDRISEAMKTAVSR
jgi:hypothetical protein